MSQSIPIAVPSDPAQRALLAASIATTAAILLPQVGGDKNRALTDALHLYMAAFSGISRTGQPQAEQQEPSADNASS